MTARQLAWRTVRSRPARAALAVAGVTMIGALLLDMLLLSRGLLVSFRDLLDTAGYDVRVVATDALPLRLPIQHATELEKQIAALKEVRDVAVVRRERTVALVRGRPGIGITLVNASPGASGRAWRLTAGRELTPAGPEGENVGERQLVVSQRLASAMSLSPGSPLRLRSMAAAGPSAIPAVVFRVAGIAEFELDPGDDYIATTDARAFRQVQGQAGKDDADLVLVTSRPEFGGTAAAAAIQERHPDLRAYSNEQLVAQFNQNGFAYFRQISFVLSTITLGFAFLLIATLLSVSVNQRLDEVAALRALGIPVRRIAATLVWESAWLVGAGGLLSIPVGGLLAVQLDRILRAMPGFPQRLHFFVFEPESVAWHAGLLAVTAIGAAVYPVWIAIRLPIAATLRKETLS
jgi:ABC-type lipoprotein release transport system permease subunit